MASTTSSSPAAASARPSWGPFLAAFLIPAVVVSAALLFIHSRPGNDPNRAALAATQVGAQMVDLLVTVQDDAGAPLADRAVTFLHERPSLESSAPEQARTEIRKTTDSAGMASISVPKEGHVSIAIAGRVNVEKIKDLEKSAPDQQRFTIVLTPGEVSAP